MSRGRRELRGLPRSPAAALPLAALTLAALLLAGGCGARGGGGGAGGSIASPADQAPTPAPIGAPRVTKLLTIVEENHGAQSALAGMPYLASLASSHGRAAGYSAVTHPSLPNYLALAGGSTFGVTDDRGPASHPVPGQSVFGQALAAGHTAKAYEESMPTPCARADSGRYAVRHNPWAYFADDSERAGCLRYDVPAGTPDAGALHDDVTAGTLPDLGWVTPDLCNDAHDCSLAIADGWLHQWLPHVLAGPDYQAGRLAVIVTFDEAEGSGPNAVLTTVISPATDHVVSPMPCTHYSWTRYVEDLLQVPPLRSAATAPSLRDAFPLSL